MAKKILVDKSKFDAVLSQLLKMKPMPMKSLKLGVGRVQRLR